MPALGQERRIGAVRNISALPPRADVGADIVEPPLSAISGLMARSKKCMVILFDHSVSARQYCVGDRDAKCFCRSQINRQLDLRGLLDRKIKGLRPGQDLLHVLSSAMIHRSPWRPIAHQGTSICELRDVRDGGESVLERQRGNGLTHPLMQDIEKAFAGS